MKMAMMIWSKEINRTKISLANWYKEKLFSTHALKPHREHFEDVDPCKGQSTFPSVNWEGDWRLSEVLGKKHDQQNAPVDLQREREREIKWGLWVTKQSRAGRWVCWCLTALTGPSVTQLALQQSWTPKGQWARRWEWWWAARCTLEANLAIRRDQSRAPTCWRW